MVWILSTDGGHLLLAPAHKRAATGNLYNRQSIHSRYVRTVLHYIVLVSRIIYLIYYTIRFIQVYIIGTECPTCKDLPIAISPEIIKIPHILIEFHVLVKKFEKMVFYFIFKNISIVWRNQKNYLYVFLVPVGLIGRKKTRKSPLSREISQSSQSSMGHPAYSCIQYNILHITWCARIDGSLIISDSFYVRPRNIFRTNTKTAADLHVL